MALRVIDKETHHLFMTRGDSGIIPVRVRNKTEDEETGEIVYTPYEFQEGDRVVFRLKRKMTSEYSEIACEKDCYIDFENNKCYIKLVPEDTENCAFKDYRYECELIKGEYETDPAKKHNTFIDDSIFTIGAEAENHNE